MTTLSEFLTTRSDEPDPDWLAQVRALVARAVGRGDVAVIYENHDFGHPDQGDLTVTTYGSAASMLERSQFPEPPTTLPDIGGAIGWRYQLIATIDEV